MIHLAIIKLWGKQIQDLNKKDILLQALLLSQVILGRKRTHMAEEVNLTQINCLLNTGKEEDRMVQLIR